MKHRFAFTISLCAAACPVLGQPSVVSFTGTAEADVIAGSSCNLTGSDMSSTPGTIAEVAFGCGTPPSVVVGASSSLGSSPGFNFLLEWDGAAAHGNAIPGAASGFGSAEFSAILDFPVSKIKIMARQVTTAEASNGNTGSGQGDFKVSGGGRTYMATSETLATSSQILEVIFEETETFYIPSGTLMVTGESLGSMQYDPLSNSTCGGSDSIRIQIDYDDCPLDWNGDGVINLTDLNQYTSDWSAMAASTDWTTTGAGSTSDDYGKPDGTVNLSDLNFFVTLWTPLVNQSCP